MRSLRLLGLLVLLFPLVAQAADGNRLAYLDESDPYYVGRSFPKLTTPQWVGEDGVEAVVILGIDDLRDSKKYEAYLRPILNRLKKIDGRAALSVMCNQVVPDDPQLQAWLKEGLSLETHTFDHPCPLLQGGDFAKAKGTYEKCIDLLGSVPNSKPVAFRMPCCDSLNTPSPRFYAEMFNKATAKGNFLTIDTSVFNVFTASDPALPRELVLDSAGKERFRKYVPYDRSFVNTIEDYPYPYVLGRLCWQFPCVTPSDWEAQHLQKPNNPLTVADMKAALECTVVKQGVYCLVFHPHGWIGNEQVVDLIDHAVSKHGKKVKFLTFREAQERIDKHLLGGVPLRDAKTGQDNGVRLLDVNNDGYIDVVIGNDKVKQTRRWDPTKREWGVSEFPLAVVAGEGKEKRPNPGLLFGIVQANGAATVFNHETGWHYAGAKWIEDKRQAIYPGRFLRDLDGDGRCEVVFGREALLGPAMRGVLAWSEAEQKWLPAPFKVPESVVLATIDSDTGTRFIDIDEDGRLDLVWSNEKNFGLYLFKDLKDGWSRKVLEGKPGDKGALPLIAAKGTNNGMWAHSRHLWWQNENTNLLSNLVDRRSFISLLADVELGPKSPAAGLKSVQARPGFTVELMAAEPLVQDPVALAFGPDGKLWVVEMGDYPLGIDGKGKPGGKVKYLESTKGDGKYDKATLFLDNVPFPTGVLPWRKGVLVTAAPDIFYAEDADGDGKADKREVLFTGFREGNQQHRINSLAWGLDNWIYCANGDSGGKVKSVKTGQTLDISGRDLRIRPDTGAMDLQAGPTQFGRTRDDWGNWFGNNNSNPLWHFALADHYVRRNPHIATGDARVQVSVTPGASPVFPASRTLPRFNTPNATNHFTSACGPVIYRDDLFGPQFTNNFFVSEPVHNLVHREIMTAQGTTFTSRRAEDEQKSEFLASTDNWFRPASLTVGPDGALWVPDMYRHVIEHPEWIPKDWQQKLDLRAGHDQGRLYRVYPTGTQPRAVPRLDKLDDAGLVAALDSPSGWQRDLAQMMLLWREDQTAVPHLEKLAQTGGRPLARLHALCALDGQKALRPEVLQRALTDAHPGVRVQAVRLCEPLLAKSPELGAALLKLLDDADPQVQMQLAYTLGEWADPRAGKALGQLAVKATDRFLAAAVMSSVSAKNLDQVLPAVLGSTQKPPAALVENLLRLASASGDQRALAALLTAVGTPEMGAYAAWQRAALAGLLDALDQRGTPLAKLPQDNAELKAALQKVGGVFTQARATLRDPKASKDDQLLALRLLGRGPDQQAADLDQLAALLTPQTADDMQAAAVAALGRLRAAAVPTVLLRGWKAYGPTRRAQVLDVLLSRAEWLTAVLDAVEKAELQAVDVDAVSRQRLLVHKAPEVRQRATKLFAAAIAPDRQKLVDEYQPALKLAADPMRGVQLFAKHCANCHKLGDVGHVVGPDLASLGDKSPPFLLASILDPNRAVEARYLNYTALTKNGQALTGVLTSETGNAITLTAPEGKQQVILRADLEELISTGKSAMPEGLEKEIKPQDLADLIAHVRAQGPQLKPKVVDGNKPETVRPGADGALQLTARNAEIYGTALIFEKQHANLGFWTRDDDQAAWTIDGVKAGRYAVWLDWACVDESAGKSYVLQAGANSFTGKVATTGSWDKYQQGAVGEIVLTAGAQRLTLRPTKALNGSALMDFRGIKLVPVP